MAAGMGDISIYIYIFVFRVKDGPVGRSKLEGVFTGAAGGGGGAGGGLSGDNDESHDDEEEEMAEIRAQAFGLRHKALRRLLGSGEERRTPHELFRQVWVCVRVFSGNAAGPLPLNSQERSHR